jgi:nitrous oxidase accessory protein NosD
MANTFFVMEGQSIQAAIQAASPGDLIFVGPGTFDGSLVIDKSLTLLSLDGAGSTIINGGPDPYGFSGAIRVNAGVNFVTIGGSHNGFTINASATTTPRCFSAATIRMS